MRIPLSPSPTLCLIIIWTHNEIHAFGTTKELLKEERNLSDGKDLHANEDHDVINIRDGGGKAFLVPSDGS